MIARPLAFLEQFRPSISDTNPLSLAYTQRSTGLFPDEGLRLSGITSVLRWITLDLIRPL